MIKTKRPRGRDSEGAVALDYYQHFSKVDPLEKRGMEQMIIGVSTRKYGRGARFGLSEKHLVCD